MEVGRYGPGDDEKWHLWRLRLIFGDDSMISVFRSEWPTDFNTEAQCLSVGMLCNFPRVFGRGHDLRTNVKPKAPRKYKPSNQRCSLDK